ncbi:MAG: PPE domain-containing protein [Mycobacterium sp.]|uniref:PPE family protein, SVP subgroup n=1 Tax=Mycobacterium sp. TaxID=1785 RepID=UPI002632BB7B|nr:PPE domain-containing protein [Mycobacterium sp.]MDI3313079.1 PPE domain-containing protein [Mycobacterium sp.]
MDYALLPPEVNSARMYAGPGVGPMLTAAAAWGTLATELYSAAALYNSVISELTAGPWLGPSSASMTAAAARYAAWLSATAAQAEQAAAQAEAAAAAYETAFVSTVPPSVVAANRSLLMALVATNVLGQNTPAIAATEAQYAEMWAQDVAVMYGYAGSSASATALTPFTPPAPIANPGGVSGQAAAVAGAGGGSAATTTQTVLSHLPSAVPTALQGLASPLQAAPAATPPASGLTALLQSLDLASFPGNAGAGLAAADLGATSGAWGSASDADAKIMAEQGEITSTHELITGTLSELTGMEGRIMDRFDQLGAVRSAVSAGMGEAASIGGLSVPMSWATAIPAVHPVAVASPTPGLSVAPEAFADSQGSLFGELAVASMAGRAIGGTVSPGRRERVRPAGEPAASPGAAATHEPAQPPKTSPGVPGRGITAEVRERVELLRELAALRDSGILTDEEFSEEKRRLFGH